MQFTSGLNVECEIDIQGESQEYVLNLYDDSFARTWKSACQETKLWGEIPVVTAKLVFDGVDRCIEREGAAFDLLQPWQHHTSGPDTGINTYTFAVCPEKIAPSGGVVSPPTNAKLQLVLSQSSIGGNKTAKVRVYGITKTKISYAGGQAIL